MIEISNIKYQISKIQTKNQKHFWFLICVFDFWFLIFGFMGCVSAKEITILYTGETHAMLYPCSCPKEPDGGVARRSTLVKELRKKNPNSLLLDSGGFFAGGLMDQYTQNTQLDMERTKVALKSMELMQYDAAAVGDDEFNFGRGFFEEVIASSRIKFLSANIKSEKILPYLIKEISGTKIGIIGLTAPMASQKAGGIKFIDPYLAVKSAEKELRKLGVNIVILLSHLGEEEDLKLIDQIKDIDILIVGHGRASDEPSSKLGATIVVRPSWQGKRLGKLSLSMGNNKITDYKVEELRLSDKIGDDPAIVAILPKCFSDSQCQKQGQTGSCQNPGTAKATCEFSQAAKVRLSIIIPSDCLACSSKNTEDSLKKEFPGLSISYLYYPGPKADKLIKELGINALPAYLLGKEVEEDKGFVALKDNLQPKNDFYLLKPQVSGFSYFLKRKKEKGRLDLFFSLYDRDAFHLLDTLRAFNPKIHFLAVQQGDNFDAAKGNLEVEEDLRAVCVAKYYPEEFWNYIRCRAQNINSSWWEDCLHKYDALRIRGCSRSEEGRALLRENISLNKELEVMFGPVYLKDNQEIFGFKRLPTKEELKKILKR